MKIENFFYEDKFFKNLEEFAQDIHDESELGLSEMIREIENGSDFCVTLSNHHSLDYITGLIYENSGKTVIISRFEVSKYIKQNYKY